MKAFREVDTGNVFTYEDCDEPVLSPLAHGGRNHVFPHMVWVGKGIGERGWRHALVLKPVVHIITDEIWGDGEPRWVVEKCQIKGLY